MKVLFVSSGNNPYFEIAPFIRSQGESLKENGVDVSYFPLKGKGLYGYLKNVTVLRKHIKQYTYDLIHSHYSFSGWISALTGTFGVPKIVSYMGCDVYGDFDENGRLIPFSRINIFSARLLQFFVKRIIVKSENLKHHIRLQKKARVIPNGVNVSQFRVMEKKEARKQLGLQPDKMYLLFLGNKMNPRKNYRLLEVAANNLDFRLEILTPYPVSSVEVPLYLNACDVLVQTSYQEGSPNIIKEAMACNTPIVSTNCGDVKWVLGNTEGCYITGYHPGDAEIKLKEAIQFARMKGKTSGRNRLKQLGLDSDTIAQKLIRIYQELHCKNRLEDYNFQIGRE
jgi:glycosyltransferase involved in cell wall biosynthesis